MLGIDGNRVDLGITVNQLTLGVIYNMLTLGITMAEGFSPGVIVGENVWLFGDGQVMLYGDGREIIWA